jgi:hypothetical protein
VVTNRYWCSGTDLPSLKREASRKGSFEKGVTRVYRAFLVHQDTVVTDMGDLEFPNELAAETAIDLGAV